MVCYRCGCVLQMWVYVADLQVCVLHVRMCVSDVAVWTEHHNMMLAQQLTDGCANHFRDAFSELALLQQQGMFCDITLFICEDIVATNVSRQATTDPDAAANTDSSTHDRPTDGNTEQVRLQTLFHLKLNCRCALYMREVLAVKISLQALI